MNDARDPNLIIDSWLDEGPTDLPESTRRAITTSVRTINQKRGFGLPWMRPARTPLRPVLLAAALAVALAGVYLFGRFGSSESVGPPIAPSSPEPAASAPISANPPPLVGRIGYTRYDSEFGPFGDNVGTFTMNADGTDERRLDLPFASDGIVWSPDGSQILLPNSYREGQPFRPAVANADGSDYRVLEVEGTFRDMSCGAWSPDGARLLCSIADDDIPPWTASTRSRRTAPTCSGLRLTRSSECRVATAHVVGQTCPAISRLTAPSSSSFARCVGRPPILSIRRPRRSTWARSARRNRGDHDPRVRPPAPRGATLVA